MAVIHLTAPYKQLAVTANGEYRYTRAGESFANVSLLWNAQDVEPAGVFTFTFDGDPLAAGEGEGEEAAGITIDLSKTGEVGSRAVKLPVRIPTLDFTVTGLPVDGNVLLYTA